MNNEVPGMTLDHLAIWTNDLDVLKNYYECYFDLIASSKYRNPVTQFESYFLASSSGPKLEIMSKPGILDNPIQRANQHIGITHVAFGVASTQLVDAKAKQLQDAGFEIIRGPRTTGDGYYEFETFDPDGNRLEVVYAPDHS